MVVAGLPGLVALPALPAVAEVSAVGTAWTSTVALGEALAPVQARGSAAGVPSLVPARAATGSSVTAEPGAWVADPKVPKDAVPIEDRTPPVAEAAKSYLASGVARAEAADALMASPSLTDVSPQSGYLVDSVTPTLRAWGHSNNGGYNVSYSFEICNVESMTGTGCTSSGYVAGNANRWTVPAGKLEWGTQYWWKVTVKDSYDSTTTTSPLLTFTTGVRQPTVTSQLASSGVEGREFDQQSGNYATTATDLTVATAGPPLAVVRTYNSMDWRTGGIFGAGWSTRWDMKLTREVRGGVVSALVVFPDGREVRFRAKGDGTFQPPPGMHATLAEQGGGWRLMDKMSTTYLFDATGRLTKVTDQRGRSQDLTYGADGKLAKATGMGGRTITFGWTGNHVTSVSSDPVDGTALTWTYTYDGNRLTSVCAPVAAPNCTTYTYGGGSLYRSTVLDSDPTGYWRLGEKSGTTAANLGSVSGSGTYEGGVTLGQPGALTGTTDTAAAFGDRKKLSLPASSLARVQGAGSFETWFKTSANGVIAAFGAPEDTASTMVYVGMDGKLRGQLRRLVTGGSNGIAPITSAATVNDNQWHHVVLTETNDLQVMYLDGQKVGELSGVTRYTEPGYYEFAEIGWRWSMAGEWPASPTQGLVEWPFQGQIDEVAIYGKPLTAAEIAGHYAARNAVSHKLASVTLPSGRVRAANTYDTGSDRLATHTDHNGGLWKIGDISTEQQSGEALVVVTDPSNEKLEYLYDAWRGFRLRGETDQLNFTTWYEYDQAGYLTKIIDRNNIANDVFQDKRGNRIARKYCRAPGECAVEFWSYYLNAGDQFDPRNDRLLAHRDGRSGSETDNTYATTSEYNSFGEQIKQTTPATPDFPQGRAATFTYTDGSEPAIGGGTMPAGLVKTKTLPNAATGSYAYTKAGDLAEQTDPEGLITRFEHDALGRIATRTEVSDSQPNGVKTTFTYDGLGRITTETAPGVRNEISGVTHTAQTRYTYDADGHPLTVTLADLTGGDADRVATSIYDDFGRVATVTDPEGGVTKSDYNTRGWPIRHTDPRGTVVEQGYSKRGEPTTRTLKGWTGSPVNPQPAADVVLESRGYDPGGRLTSTVDAMGRKGTYVYWMDNRLRQKIADDAKLNGSATPADVVLESAEYDPAGNPIQQVSGGGLATTDLVYDAASRLSSQTFDPAALARTTSFVYDAVGNVTKRTLTAAGTSRSEVKEYVYNKSGQITRETIENGSQDLVSEVAYDDRGLVTTIIDPRGGVSGANPADFTTNLRYDAFGQLVEAVAPQTQVEKAGSVTASRSTRTVGYNTSGDTTHIKDPEGRTTTVAFDKVGRPVATTAPSYTPPGGTPITRATSSIYDKAGQLLSTTNARGFVTGFEYDQLGRQVRTTDPAPEGQTPGRWVTEYDMLGRPLAVVDPTGARAESTYDDLGRQITATQIERKPSSAIYTSRMEYNTAGHLTKKILPGNKSIKYTVNAAGEVTVEEDPLTHKTTMAYDLAGRIAKVTDALSNATQTDYDLAGRMTSVKDLNAAGTVLRTTGYGYDAASNPTTITTPEGRTTRQTFDALNRVTSLIEPVSATETITTSFGYDAVGARTRLTDGRGNTTWTSYNSLGFPETLTEPSTTAHPNLADRTWTSVYDAMGNETATIQPGGVRIDRVFDHLNRLTQESGSGAETLTSDRTFGYDLAGRQITIGDLTVDYNDRDLPLTIKRAAAQQTGYSYDALGNPTQRIDAAGTSAFTWDNANRVATTTDPVTGRTLTYGYDNADRLTSITPTSGQAGTQTYTYDDLDRVKTHTLKNGAGTQLAKITYGWDNDDNLTSKTTAGTAGAGTNTYGYDHAGRLTSWTAPGGATTTYEWDASGNRTKAGDKTFTYDERNRLTTGDGTDYTYTARGTLATETKGGTTRNLKYNAFDQLVNDGELAYTYDALGRLISRAKAGATQHYAYSGLANDIATITDNAGAVQAKYGRDLAGGVVGVQEGGGAVVSALTDLHGDLVATFNATALVDSTAYDPFGQVTAQSGAKRNLGYQGEYTDPDSGKVNMHARWYQPGTGAFGSRDSWTLDPNPSIQANRYNYANGTPLTATDPTGHSPLNDGYANGVPAGLPIYDRETVLDVFAQYGISFGGDTGTIDYSGGGGCTSGDIWGYGGGCLNFDAVVIPSSIDEAKREGLTQDGWSAPPGYWDMSAADRRYYRSQAEKVGREHGKEAVRLLWEAMSRMAGGAMPPPEDRRPGKKTCAGTYGVKVCNAIKNAAEIAEKTKRFYNECIGPTAGLERCLEWAYIIGVDRDKWDKLNREWMDQKKKGNEDNWLQSLLNGVGDFFFGDAVDCYNGDVVACGLFALNFVPGAGIAAKAGIKGISKIASKLGTAGSKVAKACGNSFMPGTLVLMADGSRKPIEEVQVGDYVTATDPTTGKSAAKQVTHLIVGAGAKDLVEISLFTSNEESAQGSSVTATAGHPFWVPSLREWIDAGDLRPGQWLQTSAGTWVQVDSVRRWTASQRVYNLSVADIHTYHVAVGDANVLVHNTTPCFRMASAIGNDPFLVRAAGEAGRSHQRSLDLLFVQLSQGNLNPGIGSKALKGTDVMYARARDGARLFFRNVNGTITIVGKANKGNEAKVIKRLEQLYGQ
ncbi:LamG-like jellyroll fold domain-containing protein [Nonomuraea sp. NPDC049152]|uniref:LamG-like jellyroll fold domain-containing protein n=1 Tax=Nonomuraea sp. NPDC049152 TaxID=3154350 RepID=UPI0033F71E54